MNIYITCPNCNGMVEIIQLNCGIFRHAELKNNKGQVNPHASEEYCNYLLKEELIYGCGKPFRIECLDGIYIPSKCEYI